MGTVAAFASLGGSGSPAFSWPVAAALFVLGFGIAFVAITFLFSGRRVAPAPKEPAGNPAEMPVVAEGLEREDLAEEFERIVDESPPMPEEAPVATPAPEDRADRLKKALAAGRISREAYEENLRKLGLAAEPVSAPTADDSEAERQRKIARLRATYEKGRIGRAVYEENLRALGVQPEPPSPPPTPVPSGPTPEEKAAKLRDAYGAGRIPRSLYEKNVRSLGLEPEPETKTAAKSMTTEEKIERLRAALAAGKITREAYERNVSALGGVVEAPATPPVPAMEERVARLREAYESGKITREAFETNLERLGVLPPAPPETSMDAAVVNPPPPPPELAEMPPSNFEERVDLLTKMFVNGRIPRSVYEKNLARLYEGVEPRLAQLRAAHEAGRITAETYDANVRRVLRERGAG
ncbi:MAG TPA: hypothetical protein VGR51_05470 [Thermoplasmata archaeon]|jgi:hypothetical protein|nr:hypothetical protein [Thermoplasmata archaeon]